MIGSKYVIYKSGSEEYLCINPFSLRTEVLSLIVKEVLSVQLESVYVLQILLNFPLDFSNYFRNEGDYFRILIL